ncbi:hypothetical protein SAMN02745883_00688 [Caminicella sporogenes DSM 14501]|uniref:Uncharacterized protein n=1 Tax=Caminicella sporogenes DSM 14501 TaxID=1121266 RepID=A0A1M6MXC3_9FIRM|nr:DUF6711 family protein [Caminicella sporogenes]RKD22458.1 hypothetical protein BET04_05345 [Caminicella sporogenes]WIF95011.1 hypothetical protein QNI18_12235 [Caminicella sporogenes]SHJ88117.1 hypothetical protein SAMN02745883_00688 [Caminicella sporogenes DSM 14501]
MIKINGVALPTPSDYRVSIMDISKAERTSAGTMVIDRIATKRKIELSWKYLNKEEVSKVLRLVSHVFFTVDYIDPQEGNWRNGTFYCGDRNIGALDYIDGNIRYKDIKFNLIER